MSPRRLRSILILTLSGPLLGLTGVGAAYWRIVEEPQRPVLLAALLAVGLLFTIALALAIRTVSRHHERSLCALNRQAAALLDQERDFEAENASLRATLESAEIDLAGARSSLQKSTHAVARLKEEFVQILERLPEGLFVLRGGRLLYANPVFAAALDCFPDALIGKTLEALVEESSALRVLQEIDPAGAPSAGIPLRFHTEDAAVELLVSAVWRIELDGAAAMLFAARAASLPSSPPTAGERRSPCVVSLPGGPRSAESRSSLEMASPGGRGV